MHACVWPDVAIAILPSCFVLPHFTACTFTHNNMGLVRMTLRNFHEDLNMIAIIGTSDQPCWLAEAIKILFLRCAIGCHVGS